MLFPVRQLVQECRIVALGVPESRERRNADEIVCDAVGGFRPALVDVRAELADEGLGARDALRPFSGLCWGCVPGLRETGDLLGVEDRVALHEGDLARDFLAVLVFLGPGERVRVDDGGTFLALTDMRAELFA